VVPSSKESGTNWTGLVNNGQYDDNGQTSVNGHNRLSALNRSLSMRINGHFWTFFTDWSVCTAGLALYDGLAQGRTEGLVLTEPRRTQYGQSGRQGP